VRRWAYAIAAVGLAAAPVHAQDVAPEPMKTPALAIAPEAAPDSGVEPFYAAHPDTLVWLRDVETRAGAAKLAELLKNSAIDGFAEGSALAASVEAALAGGTPGDDAVISTAWVRYVQALKRPVAGVDFGDPALRLKAPSATLILAKAYGAPSLAAHVATVASVNPLYAALRADAIAQGKQDDPHVRASLDRLRLVPAKGRALLVDIANAQLLLLENGQAADAMKVIVGKPDFPTPLLAGTIHYVTFNPYWHIPPDVAKRKVAPIVIKRGVKYLKAARYQTVAAFGGDKEQPVDPTSIDWKSVAAGTEVAHIRQLSGPHNMMGAMKFGFVNDEGIFLHDTPHKDLFRKAKRNLSLGCVRVERPEDLAKWLFGREPPAPGDEDSEQNVLIGDGVPIYILYLTARPDGDTIAFADDVYGLDGARAIASASDSTAK
jgi:murein L,D-transpeptidase YcbB/YkuD